MLENWLRPVSSALLKETEYQDFSLGKKIKIFRSKIPKMRKGQIALIGLEENTANAVRKELYQLSYNFKGMVITDLGNARSTEPEFLLQLIQDLLSGKIIPVLLGRTPESALTQYKAHRMVQSALNLAVIDELIPYNTGSEEISWLDYILDNSRSKLFHLSLLGSQTHFLPPDTVHNLTERHHKVMRLGNVKADLQKTEPVLRNADTLVVNLSALKASDAPAQINPSPSGLSSEEICRLCRYAGMSEKLDSVGFYGYDSKTDTNGLTAKTLAQMIWYFLDGFHNRRNDYPSSTDNMSEYVTNVQGYDQQITFWRSNKTGRWWLQVPMRTKKNLQRHRLIPCTYEDYISAANGELPNHFSDAFLRFV